MRDVSPAARPRLADGMLLGAGVLALYVVLWQTTLYRTDGHWILARLARGEPVHNNHFLYMPLLKGLYELLAPLGIGARHAALLLSSLGAAAGVALVHAASRPMGLSRRPALVCALLVAVTPPVLFFATVVEFHGPFFAAVGLGFLGAARLAQAPSLGRGLTLGLAGALGFGLHSSGLLLPALLLPWAVALRADRGLPLSARLWMSCGAAAATHLGAIVALLAVLQAMGFPEFPPAYDQGRLGGLSLASLGAVPEVLWQEWGRPYLPLSLLVLPALLARQVRARAVALLAGGATFLGLAVVLLVGRPGLGEYLLPLAPAVAVLVVEVYRRAFSEVAVVITATVAMVMVLTHDVEGPAYRRFAAGVRAVAGGAPPFLLLAEERELGACLVCMPRTPFHVLSQEAVLPPATVASFADALVPGLLAEPWREGHAVLLSERAVAWLEDPELTPSGRTIVAALRADARFEAVHAAGFEGWRLHPRR